MKRVSWLSLVLLVGAALAGTAGCAGKKKIRAYTSTIEKTFRNETAGPALGLHVAFTSGVRLVRRNSDAERFETTRGDGSKTIELLGASQPVEASESLTLRFGTHNSRVQIKNWWWTDGRGRRIGPKDHAANERREQKKERKAQEREAQRREKERARQEKQQKKQTPDPGGAPGASFEP